jgi:hypothetical protein
MVEIDDTAHIVLVTSIVVTLLTGTRLCKLLPAWADPIPIYIFFSALLLEIYNGSIGSFAEAWSITGWVAVAIMIVAVMLLLYASKHAVWGLVVGAGVFLLVVGTLFTGPFVLLPWLESQLGLSVSIGVFIVLVLVACILGYAGFQGAKSNPWIAERSEELLVIFVCSLSIDVLADCIRDGISDFQVLSFDYVWGIIFSGLWVVYNAFLLVDWWQTREQEQAAKLAAAVKEADYQRLKKKEEQELVKVRSEEQPDETSELLKIDDFPEASQKPFK